MLIDEPDLSTLVKTLTLPQPTPTDAA